MPYFISYFILVNFAIINKNEANKTKNTSTKSSAFIATSSLAQEISVISAEQQKLAQETDYIFDIGSQQA
mgnify:CR=1 FL=1